MSNSTFKTSAWPVRRPPAEPSKTVEPSLSAARLALSLALILAVVPGISLAEDRTFDLLTAGVEDIQRAVSAGALTYERLVRLYLNRIKAYDKRGPRLNAIISVNPSAIEIARALDAERRAKGLRGPLHGIPIAIKDNIDVVDLPATGGNLALAGSYPARDATVIRKLREAGAILLAKTNMDELALGSQGLSSFGGQILNPYDLTRNPGGSSGGSGVAVSAAFATIAVGTETGFSIRSPASNNSIVGIAPSEGLVSRAGVIPISFTQDRVGAFGKSVADAAVLLTYLRGFDVEDLSTSVSLGRVPVNSYADSLDDRLSGSRIGVLRDLFRKGEQFKYANDVVEKQIAVMRSQRAVVIDGLTSGLDLISLIPDLRVNSYELRFAFDAYLLRRGPSSPVKTLSELVASGKYLKSDNLVARLEQTMKVEALDTDRGYLARLENRKMLQKLLIEMMDRHRLDALVYPVKSLGAPPIGASDAGERDNPISAVTGLPAIAVPAGVDQHGLPLAIEFMGRPFTEPRLIQIAYAYERSSRQRVLPKTTPRLPDEAFSYK